MVSASRASAEPSPSAPTSPMMIRAGAALNHRKPMQAPANAAAIAARSSGLTTRAVDVGVPERPVADDHEGAEAHQRRAAGEAVEAVGDVDGVRRRPDDQPGAQITHTDVGRSQPG